MLEELRSQLQSDQASDTQTFQNKQDQFDTHIQKLANEIAQLTTDIEALNKEIERLTGLISQADLNLASFATRIANLKAILPELDTANANDNRYYNRRMNELQSLYNAFTTILERLQRLTGSVSAVNVPSHINLTDSEKRDLEWRNQNPNVTSRLDAALVKSFLQVESESSESAQLAMQLSQQYDSFLENTLNADQGALRKLVGILSSIQEEILGQKTAAQKHLDDINAQYKEMRDNTEAEIKLNENAHARQTENRNKYLAEKARNIEEKESKEKRRELLTKEKVINEDLRSNLKATDRKSVV